MSLNARGRKLIATGSPMEAKFAYSRAMAAGDWCFVAGTTGYDYATMTMPEDAGAQAANCLATIRRALEEAGFEMADVVRMHFYVTDPAHMEAAAPALQAALGEVRPPSTAVVCNLIAPEMKIEIEATAFRG